MACGCTKKDSSCPTTAQALAKPHALVITTMLVFAPGADGPDGSRPLCLSAVSALGPAAATVASGTASQATVSIACSCSASTRVSSMRAPVGKPSACSTPPSRRPSWTTFCTVTSASRRASSLWSQGRGRLLPTRCSSGSTKQVDEGGGTNTCGWQCIGMVIKRVYNWLESTQEKKNMTQPAVVPGARQCAPQ